MNNKSFNTITAAAVPNTAEQVSNKMDRNFRIFSEGVTSNQKVYRNSTIHAHVNHNLSNLRTKTKHFYERVP